MATWMSWVEMIRRLWLGTVLIALASSVLLVSDWGRRQAQEGRIPRVAILHACLAAASRRRCSGNARCRIPICAPRYRRKL